MTSRLTGLIFLCCLIPLPATAAAIDRQALVRRHNVTLAAPDALSPLSVGNGQFAFTVDVTGLQTFEAFHNPAMPLCTMAQWGWHTAPNPEGFKLEDILRPYDSGGRPVPYAEGLNVAGRQTPATVWLRQNPHKMDLGRLGLILRGPDGREAALEDLHDIHQTLDLWTGLIESRFTFAGRPVVVRTVAHPTVDGIAVRIESPLVAEGRLQVRLAFAYAKPDSTQPADWTAPERHRTEMTVEGPPVAHFQRTLDQDHYVAMLGLEPHARLERAGPHTFRIWQLGRERLDLGLAFWPDGQPATQPVEERLRQRRQREDQVPEFAAAAAASAAAWQRFWLRGGAVDLSESTDPRWRELERRIVLSQYNTAVNCAGDVPPQESGLVANSWYGKFHLEMHWWHAAHFALWGRLDLLERSLPYYQRILPQARATAAMQGYAGARWPKMTDPTGRESPSTVGVFLVWQQPHPIYYAELCWRQHRDRATLERYREIMHETAQFMASYARLDPATGRYMLGPPLIPAQESYGNDKARGLNPTFELAYWRWGLETAQQWRLRLGLEREPTWDWVHAGLAPLPVRDGIYVGLDAPPFLITQDHPSMLMALGFLPPSPAVDLPTMNRTLDHVLTHWDWPSTWGWDYPLMAMTAARLGRPEDAVKALLLEAPKNRYLPNGHNYQRANLPLYLPGNGGLLAAVAMMCAGWDGAPADPAPGFPRQGWIVKWEGLVPMP
jgi:hypothetical protein